MAPTVPGWLVWLPRATLAQGRGRRRSTPTRAPPRSHGSAPSPPITPVGPACHYASGGVRTDLWGRSDLPGLYATGEAACSGVHGAATPDRCSSALTRHAALFVGLFLWLAFGR